MKTKNIILVVLAGILILGGIIAWLVTDTGAPPESKVKPPETAPHEVLNTSLKEEKDGKKTWDLEIGSMIYDKDRDVNVLKGIKGTFYKEDGSSLILTADAGEIDMKTKSIVLTSNPAGAMSTGGTLKADTIRWINDKQQVEAEGNVIITKDDIIATAKKAIMETTIDQAKLLGEAKIRKGVQQ